MLLVRNAYRCAKNPGDKKTLSEMNLMCTLWDKKCDCCSATNLTSVTVPSHTAVWLLVNNTVSDRLGSICPSHLLSSNLLTQHCLVADEAPLNLNVLISRFQLTSLQFYCIPETKRQFLSFEYSKKKASKTEPELNISLMCISLFIRLMSQ